MNSETPLIFLMMLADFLLKITFAFGIFWGISRLITAPNRRFVLWLSFLGSAGIYWLWILASFWKPAVPAQVLGRSQADPAGLLAWSTLPIPSAWAFPISIAVRTAALVYLAVIGYRLIHYIRKVVHLRWVLGFACNPPDEIAKAFDSLARDLGIDNCKLLVLTGITSAATVGWMRPIVLLPALCCERELSETKSVLRHELHHVRRRDFLWSRAAGILKTLLFFHPVVWYVERRMQLDRELACDFAVLADSPARHLQYAECLVSYARLNAVGADQPWGIDFTAASAYLKTRVHYILAEPKKCPRWLYFLRGSSIAILLTAFIAVLPALAIVLAYVQTQETQREQVVAPVHHLQTRRRIASARRTPAAKIRATNSSGAAMNSVTGSPQTPIIPAEMAKYSAAPAEAYPPSTPPDLGQSPDSPTDISDHNSSPSVYTGGSNPSVVKMPGVASVLIDAARRASTVAVGGGHEGQDSEDSHE